jgi:hypothetical protein
MGLENIRNLSFTVTDMSDVTDLYNILHTLKTDIVVFGEAQHLDTGVHKIATGTGVGARPAPGAAGRLYFDLTNKKLYVDALTDWDLCLEPDAEDIAYSLSGVPEVVNVEQALDRLFGMLGATTNLSALLVQYAFNPADEILGSTGTVTYALGQLSDHIQDMTTAGITHLSVNLQTIIASLLTMQARLTADVGASGVGFDDEDCVNIAGVTVQAVLESIDATLTTLATLPAPPASSVLNSAPDTFFSTNADVQTELNQVGHLLREDMEDFVYLTAFIPGTVTTGTKSWEWPIPFNIGVGHIVDVNVQDFVAHLSTSPEATVTVQFVHKNCADITTLSIAAGSNDSADTVTEYNDLALGDTVWVNVTGTSGANLSIACVLKLQRGY